MKLPKIIQGGMGVAISNWKLARAVATQGHLGVVSGTAIHMIFISRLMSGDTGGHVRRALSAFPFPDSAKEIQEKYFVAEPKSPLPPYIRPPLPSLNPPRSLDELTVIANFVEVYLAKEGHDNAVGLNLLEKVQLQSMPSLYGAMLAGVDYVIMGAGVPVQIPGILDRLITHQPTSYRVDVLGATAEDDFRVHFDPQSLYPGAAEEIGELKRPKFLPVVSSVVLAKSLIKRSSGRVDGFVVEGPTAGGHNAPPRGAMRLDENNEPIYGEKDSVNLSKIKELGLPFWLAGGYDTHEGLQSALDSGAAGIQVGTAFAYCEESGMDAALRQRIVKRVLAGDITVSTSHIASPTGFPFKVVLEKGTLSDPEVYADRERLCDIGLLRHPYKRLDGGVGYRCAAEPVALHLAKGGSEEDTLDRKCLCNNLCATAGYPQHRKDGYVEPPMVTAGDTLKSIGKFIQPGRGSYTTRDVLDCLLGV